MKYRIKSIIYCSFISLFVYLFFPILSYGESRVEHIALPKELYNNIYRVDQIKEGFVLYIRNPLSERVQKEFRSNLFSSSFIKGVRYSNLSITLETKIASLGYIFTPSSPTFTLFYDSTGNTEFLSNKENLPQALNKDSQAQRSNSIQKSPSSARLTSQEKSEIRGVIQRTSVIDIIPAAGRERKETENGEQKGNASHSDKDNKQTVELRKKISNIESGAYIRERITRNEENDSKKEHTVQDLQTTGKQHINRGGPEQWTQDKNMVRDVSLEEEIKPINKKDGAQIVKEQSNSSKKSNSIQKVRARITPGSLVGDSEKAGKERSTMKDSQSIVSPPTVAPVLTIEAVQIEQPVPASENNALVQEEAEKKEEATFEKEKGIATTLLNRGEYEKALVLLKNIRQKVTSKSEKEELLYLIAEVSEVISRTKPEYRVEAMNNFTVAMNFNLQSDNVPDALLQLGLLNGAMKNTKEIEAYFTIIRTKYPKNKNVPLTYYYLGKYYQDNKQYSKALVQYKMLEEQYPQFEFLREVIVSIIQCLDALGYYNDIKPYIAFIDNRWPTLYQVYPDILLAKAKVYFDLQEYRLALDSYWQYVNIVPKAKDIDMIYSRIGDSYLHLGEVEKARSVYKSIVKNYKDTEGYVLAKIRLVEDSIIDDISEDSPFLSVFDRSFSTVTRDTYQDIITNYSQSSFAPIAKAKLALWYFWMKDYKEALVTIDSFKKEYPNSKLLPSIHMLIGRILSALAEDPKTRKEIPELWKKYSSLFTQEGSLMPEYRLNIAKALASEGDDDQAVAVLESFFKGRKYKGISEQAISVMLDIYKKAKNWKGIEDLYYRVLDWDLPRDVYTAVVFNAGIAFEYMEVYDKADNLFQRLLSSVFTSPYYRGVSAYYIAKNGLRAHQPPARVYPFAQESLNSLLLASKEKEKVVSQEELNTDIIQSLIQLRDITKRLGSKEESLRYTILQEQYEPENILLQIEKAKLVKEMGNIQEWSRILEGIIQRDPSSSYARLARTELIGEQNRKRLQELSQ